MSNRRMHARKRKRGKDDPVSEGECALRVRVGNSRTDTADAEYRVGPGRPPKEYQFKPGQSGNPRGAKRKTTSLVPDIKGLLESALRNKVTLKQGEKELIVTMAAVGIQQLVNQFAKGDRHARRDLIILADKLGVDLTAGHSDMSAESLDDVISKNDEVLLADFVKHHAQQYIDTDNVEDPHSENAAAPDDAGSGQTP